MEAGMFAKSESHNKTTKLNSSLKEQQKEAFSRANSVFDSATPQNFVQSVPEKEFL